MTASRLASPKSIPIIALHGAGGGGWEWSVWARVLRAAGADFRAPDLMPAASGLAGTRWCHYQDQVKRWVEGPVAPVLMGASLGGRLALELADRAAALVLVNPVPLEGRSGFREPEPVKHWRNSPLAGTRDSLPDADFSTWVFCQRRWRDESGSVLDTLAREWAPPTHTPPSLVIAGAEDRDVPTASSRALAERIGARFEEVPGASHLGPLLGDSAAVCAERALEFLDRTLPPGWRQS